MDCDCWYTPGGQIRFCPMHKAAPAMLEALVDIEALLGITAERLPADRNFQRHVSALRETARSAVRAARGES